jgi:hypothetical protein
VADNPLSELDVIADQIARLEAQLLIAKQDRDALVRLLVSLNFSEREISRAARVSAVRVHQIKKKEAARA